MNTQIIILAAGKGTRMNSDLPKVLVELKGKPLVQYLLDSVNQLSNSLKPLVVVGYKHELVEARLGPNFIYVQQKEQLGTADAVCAAMDQLTSKNVVVLYGDHPFLKTSSLANFIQTHEQSQATISLLTTTVPNFDNEFSGFLHWGRIIRNEQNEVVAIREFIDASPQEKMITEVSPAMYLFNSDWLRDHLGQVVKNQHGEYYLTDLIEIALKDGALIRTVAINPEEAFGVNTPDQLKQAESLITI